jgi:CRISPR/Cas system-associated exonuclease Cas4 (RecB family)
LNTFLNKTASHLISKYNENLEHLLIVLPNKRAGLFLKQELSKLIKNPIWIPEIIGTEDFIEKTSEAEIIDNLTQLFELYECYKSTSSEAESFEDFSKWGQILLHDFNEIDRYLIPPEKFFKEINDIRAIEVWNLGDKDLSDFQKQYLKFWNELSHLYTAYKTTLESKNMAYQGMAFRKVAEEIAENPEFFIENKIAQWQKIIFVGFNALNQAEETIISSLIKQNKAEILWDADKYYLEDDLQESGFFLRKYIKKEIFSPFNWINDKFNQTRKNIEIIGVPQQIGQAKYLSSILSKIDAIDNYKDTAIVLADENMLIPVMQSIPDEISNINVTMGYPLKNTSLTIFFEIIFQLFMNAEKFGSKETLTYHYKDLINLFRLSFSNVIIGNKTVEKLSSKITQQNWVFINNEKLQYINDALPFKLPVRATILDLINISKTIISIGKEHYQQLIKKSTSNSFHLELEYLFHFSKLFNQLDLLLTQQDAITSFKGFYSIFRQLLSSFSIELYGEPLQGLQIMGMLETRNIDFKNVIIIGANEGVLPKGKTFNSFIPYDLKSAYQLPTHYEKDAVYAYHFYRLIQNAENIYITHNTETNEFGSGEQSRFITQIEHELNSSKKPNINISKKLINYPTSKFEQSNITIEKDDAVIEHIKEIMSNQLSPTAIITYINCPLDFYYKYILKIKEEEDVEETIEHNTFGSFIHEIFELLYKEYINIELKEEHIKLMLKKANKVTHEVFSKNFNDTELKSGKNLLIYSVAQTYINNFLKKELNLVKKSQQTLVVKSLEQKLDYTTNYGFEGNTVKLIGTIDRVDSIGSLNRIIDYKTGSVEPAELKIKELDDLLLPNKKNKAFQVLFYALLYHKNNPTFLSNTTECNAGIISFRKLTNDFMKFNLNDEGKITLELLTNFENEIKTICEEMIKKEIPYTHNTSSKFCKFCN